MGMLPYVPMLSLVELVASCCSPDIFVGLYRIARRVAAVRCFLYEWFGGSLLRISIETQ